MYIYTVCIYIIIYIIYNIYIIYIIYNIIYIYILPDIIYIILPNVLPAKLQVQDVPKFPRREVLSQLTN